jgi:hypothetical protein
VLFLEISLCSAVPCVVLDVRQPLPVVLRVGALVTICAPCGVLRWCGDFSRFGEREVCGCGRRSRLELKKFLKFLEGCDTDGLVSRLIEEEECCLVEHLGGISVSVHG